MTTRVSALQDTFRILWPVWPDIMERFREKEEWKDKPVKRRLPGLPLWVWTGQMMGLSRHPSAKRALLSLFLMHLYRVHQCQKIHSPIPDWAGTHSQHIHTHS